MPIPETERQRLFSGGTTGDPIRDMMLFENFEDIYDAQYQRYQSLSDALAGKAGQLAIGTYERHDPGRDPTKPWPLCTYHVLAVIREPCALIQKRLMAHETPRMTFCMPVIRYVDERLLVPLEPERSGESPPNAPLNTRHFLVQRLEGGEGGRAPSLSEITHGWFSLTGTDVPEWHPVASTAGNVVTWDIGDEAADSFFKAQRGTGSIYDRTDHAVSWMRYLFQDLGYEGPLVP